MAAIEITRLQKKMVTLKNLAPLIVRPPQLLKSSFQCHIFYPPPLSQGVYSMIHSNRYLQNDNLLNSLTKQGASSLNQARAIENGHISYDQFY